jgi:hypothetical protein
MPPALDPVQLDRRAGPRAPAHARHRQAPGDLREALDGGRAGGAVDRRPVARYVLDRHAQPAGLAAAAVGQAPDQPGGADRAAVVGDHRIGGAGEAQQGRRRAGRGCQLAAGLGGGPRHEHEAAGGHDGVAGEVLGEGRAVGDPHQEHGSGAGHAVVHQAREERGDERHVIASPLARHQHAVVPAPFPAVGEDRGEARRGTPRGEPGERGHVPPVHAEPVQDHQQRGLPR